MSNESVTECHGTSHYIYIPFHCGAHDSLCLHLLRVMDGSRAFKRSDLMYAMWRLNHSRGVI